MTVTVLLTGAGAPGASGIIRSLRLPRDRTLRLVGVDMDPDAYGFTLTDAADTVPAGTDNDYVPRIRDIVSTEDVDVVLPLTTAELLPLARDRDTIDAEVMVSARDALAVANDKAKLYEFLTAEGFASAPTFYKVETRSEFVEAVRALGYPGEPVCFKPPVASGMRGFRVLEEGGDRLERLLGDKPDSTITTLDDILPVLSSAETFPPLVVMEYLPGTEYSVDVLCRESEVAPVIPRSRATTRAGITFAGTVTQDTQLIEQARAICDELNLRYNVNLQFKLDAEGTPKLIEINPRVSGTIIMCVGAGANLPYLGVTHALGESVPDPEIAWGTEMVRYWQEVFRSPQGDAFHVEPARHTPAAPESQ